MDYNIAIKRKKVKNISIRVVSSQEVILTLPFFVTQERGLDFLESKRSWIEKKLSEFPNPLKLENGEIFYYLGYPYTITLCHDKSVFFDETNLYLPYHDKEKALDMFLRKKAKKIFLQLIKSWEEKLNKKVQRVSIKKMKTRWGSCNTQKAYINLNLNLIHKPLKVIDYVILHEMAHLTHPNHSKEFHLYVESFMDDWKEREKLLKYSFYSCR